MSAALIANCLEFESAALTAISHKPTEGMHGASGEASDASKKDKKKKRGIDACEDEAAGESPKKAKREGPFKPKPELDGPLQCIFIERECIPLWPLYSHKAAEGTFIRVDRGESWLSQLIVASRKSATQGYEPQERGEKIKPFSRTLTTSPG